MLEHAADPLLQEDVILRMLDSGDTKLYSRIIDIVDSELLPIVLDYCNGNQSRAARVLGLARLTLRKKLRRPRSAESQNGRETVATSHESTPWAESAH